MRSGREPLFVSSVYREKIKKRKMVYFFTSDVVSPAAFIYVGKDKTESRETIFPMAIYGLVYRDTDMEQMRI